MKAPKRIHLSRADVGSVEEKYLLEALRSGWVAPLGPDVDAFENEIAERVGVRHALAVSSGTAALHLALLHLGARRGTVVVLPSMTFAASANAVAYTGAEPVFVDSTPDDGNVDALLFIETVDALLAEKRPVVAAMSVDLFGRTCDYDVLLPALAERGIPLVEDSAEALGATHNGRPAGSLGKVAAFSFNGNKIMTTSSGGMLVSDDEHLVAHARKLATQSREPVPWYEHKEIGHNYRLSNLLAALGRAQLTRLDTMIERRRQHRDQYAAGLAALPLRFLGRDGSRTDAHDNCWLTTAVLTDPTVDVNGLLRYLSSNQIEARHLWKPLHLQPVFRDARFFGTGVSEALFAQGIALPSGSELEPEDIDVVVGHITDRLTQPNER